MKERTREEQEAIADAAERQMRRCLMMQEIEQRLEREHADELAERLGPYIAISREAGAGGSQIAQWVGEKLGWEVMDSKLLDFMAQRYHLPRDILDVVDEELAGPEPGQRERVRGTSR
jgi:cytidylate kinase